MSIRILRRGLIPFIALLSGIALPALSQETGAGDSLRIMAPEVHQDSLLLEGAAVRPGSLVMTKSPGLAVGLSAALPGAGQFYNESYWKVPIVMGLGGYFVGEWIRNDNLADDYRQQYEDSKTEENPNGNTNLLATRDFYKNQRDTFVWYFVILYIANMVDAYVDANLYDFDVGEDLSIRLIPEAGMSPERSFGIGLSVEF